MRDRALIDYGSGETRSASMRRIFIRDMIVPARIGAFRHERGIHQRVRINVELLAEEEAHALDDDLRTSSTTTRSCAACVHSSAADT